MMENVEDCPGGPHADSGSFEAVRGCLRPVATREEGRGAKTGRAMDRLTAEERSRLMSRIRGKDTKPEMAVRRLVHGMGFRYRLHRRDLPGSPDLVLPRHRKVILVHGCFWHSHAGCRAGRVPASNTGYWEPKGLSRNNRGSIVGRLSFRVVLSWPGDRHRYHQIPF